MNIKKYSIIGFFITVILGSILHFTYEFFDKNLIVGYFSATNESTFEHLKLLATPILLYSIVEYILYGKEKDNFILIKALSILIGSLSIMVIFYTYTGIIGRNFLVMDIALFFISVFLAYYFSYIALKNNWFNLEISNTIGIILIFIIIFAMIFFTTNPPKIKLFLDPVTNTYGIN